MKNVRIWLAALAAIFALVVASCASNEGDTTGPTAGAEETGATSATGGSGAIPEFSTL